MRPVQWSDRVINKAKWIMQRCVANKCGAALPLVLIVVALLAFMGMHTNFSAITEANTVRNYENGVRARYLAEGMLNQAMAEIRENPLQPDLSALPGVQLTPNHRDANNIPHAYHLVAIATSGGITKAVEVDVDLFPAFLKYAVYGSDSVTLNWNFAFGGLLDAVFDLLNGVGYTLETILGLLHWNLPEFSGVNGPIYAGSASIAAGYGDVTVNTARTTPEDARQIRFNAEAFKTAAGNQVYTPSSGTLDIKELGQYRHPLGLLVIDVDRVDVNKTGIIYVNGNVNISEATNFDNDVTIFATGDIVLNGPIYTTHKIALISQRDINLGSYDVFGSEDNPALIMAEGTVFNTDFNPDRGLLGLCLIDAKSIANTLNYRTIYGTVAANVINLKNMNIFYNQDVLDPEKMPPLPTNFGLRDVTLNNGRLATSNWNDLGLQ